MTVKERLAGKGVSTKATVEAKGEVAEHRGCVRLDSVEGISTGLAIIGNAPWVTREGRDSVVPSGGTTELADRAEDHMAAIRTATCAEAVGEFRPSQGDVGARGGRRGGWSREELETRVTCLESFEKGDFRLVGPVGSQGPGMGDVEGANPLVGK